MASRNSMEKVAVTEHYDEPHFCRVHLAFPTCPLSYTDPSVYDKLISSM